MIMVIAISLLTIGCQNKTKDQKTEESIDYIFYETEEEKQIREGKDENRIRQYLQSDEKGIGEDGTKRNIFKTDEALYVTQILSERKDVRHAHAASSPTQIVVFVNLKDYQDPHIAKRLEEEVRKVSPHKDIYVYTDQIDYNRMEDLKSSMKARQTGNNIQRFLEEQLNLDIKD